MTIKIFYMENNGLHVHYLYRKDIEEILHFIEHFDKEIKYLQDETGMMCDYKALRSGGNNLGEYRRYIT